jgi:plastocyanin
MKLFLALALLAAPGAMATPCPADIVGPGKQGGKPGPPDGEVTVEDLIAVLGKFGIKNPPFDPVSAGKSKGVIDIEDLLELLKTFGKKGCTKPSTGKTMNVNWVIRAYGPMTAGVGDTVSFAWGGNHNVFLHPSGTCNQRGSTLVGSQSARKGSFTFTKPGKYTFACQVGSHCNQGQIVTFTVGGGGSAPPPSGPAPVCANSPRQACKMMCPPVQISCPMGQCAMRQGNCCSFKCSQAGGVVTPPTPPTPTCIAGQSCGGQTMQGCGTACPKVCGQPPQLMCMRMCKRGYQCPQAGSPSGTWWDARAGKCVPSKGACTPTLVAGRPFIVDATPMMASAVQSVSSDWL